MEEWHIPALSIAVLADGEVVWQRGMGLRSILSYDTVDAANPVCLAALRRLVEPDSIVFGSGFPTAPPEEVEEKNERRTVVDELDVSLGQLLGHVNARALVEPGDLLKPIVVGQPGDGESGFSIEEPDAEDLAGD